MAKKKPAKPRKPAAGRKAARKNPRKGARAVVRKRKAKPAPVAPVTEVVPALGRPKVSGDELLYLLFKDDYHARNIFEFLRVKSVKELEQFSASEILGKVWTPIKETVDRIRRSLADRNRCLLGDDKFALEHQARERKNAQATKVV